MVTKTSHLKTESWMFSQIYIYIYIYLYIIVLPLFEALQL